MSDWSWSRFWAFQAILLAVFAAGTFGALDWPSADDGNLQPFPVATSLFLWLQAVQFVGPPAVIIAILWRDPDFVDVPKLYAALLTASSTLFFMADRGRDPLGLWLIGIWSAGGAICYGLGIPWAAWLTPGRTRKPVYLAATAAMLGGSLLGALAWSETIPEALARAARSAAAGRPYCVEPGPGRDGLKGVRFFVFAGQDEFWPIGINAIVEKDGQRQYMRWSFPEGRFLPADRNSLNQMPSDDCKPVAGGNLPWY